MLTTSSRTRLSFTTSSAAPHPTRQLCFERYWTGPWPPTRSGTGQFSRRKACRPRPHRCRRTREVIRERNRVNQPQPVLLHKSAERLQLSPTAANYPRKMSRPKNKRLGCAVVSPDCKNSSGSGVDHLSHVFDVA